MGRDEQVARRDVVRQRPRLEADGEKFWIVAGEAGRIGAGSDPFERPKRGGGREETIADLQVLDRDFAVFGCNQRAGAIAGRRWYCRRSDRRFRTRSERIGFGCMFPPASGFRVQRRLRPRSATFPVGCVQTTLSPALPVPVTSMTSLVEAVPPVPVKPEIEVERVTPEPSPVRSSVPHLASAAKAIPPAPTKRQVRA